MWGVSFVDHDEYAVCMELLGILINLELIRRLLHEVNVDSEKDLATLFEPVFCVFFLELFLLLLGSEFPFFITLEVLLLASLDDGLCDELGARRICNEVFGHDSPEV